MYFSSINALQDVQFVMYSLLTSTSNITTISYFLAISAKLRQMLGKLVWTKKCHDCQITGTGIGCVEALECIAQML
jgi:hypothetical protein